MRRRTFLITGLALGTVALHLPEAARAQDDYAQPELLVETGWVVEHRAAPDVRFVDMRAAEAYAAGHIPGAVRFEEGPLRNAEDRLTYLPNPEILALLLGQIGVGADTHVVAYDDQGGRLATRLWYVLNAFGHTRVSVVNGGWLKWADEKRPITTEVPHPTPVTFKPKVVPEISCTALELTNRGADVIVLDSRSSQETKLGRVPGSINVEWKENVSGPFQTFKPAKELKKLYAEKGITPDKEIITYCATGGRASQSLFALRLLGYQKVKVYYGSWADYSTRGAPIRKG